ncbi:MAG: nuclear transport factor 2 family protein [Nostoc sp.]|uniref:nuclear transport factor 2 family protein n=1 Tax=Nostoc sp. TaxID=1180 RepID=UPI002FFB550A
MITYETVCNIFKHLESDTSEKFFDSVADDVKWTVLGTQPLAGNYQSKTAFHQATFSRLNPLFSGDLKLFTRDVFVDGDTAIVELYTQATAKSGVQFNNEYCWICQFRDQQIVEVRAYLDSALVTKVIKAGTTDVR